MAYPTGLPAYAGFTASHTLAADSHASQHNSEQADIVAIATKIGTGASTPTSGKYLKGNGVGTSAWTALAAADISDLLSTVFASFYPVGCIYTETTGVNPGTTFGFGTWTAFGAGRVLVGNGTSDQAFAAGAIGGESNHTLTSTEMPSHTHTATVTDPGHIHAEQVAASTGGGLTGITGTGNLTGNASATQSTASATTGVTVANSNTGGDGTHNNLQPYIVVYFWKRTA